MQIGLDWLVDKDAYHRTLQRLDARALLEHYHAENCTEQLNRDGTTEIVHSCLLDRVEPHHTNHDANPSAALNVDKKVYCCYAGGWSGDLFHLVQKLERNESFADGLEVVGRFLQGATRDRITMRAELDALFSKPESYSTNLPAYDPAILSSWKHPHPYWGQRGITAEAIERLQLGYDDQEQRVVFPHFVNGALVGWQKRAIPGQSHPELPKYRNSPGFPKAESLYAHDESGETGPVLVVESPMSVAKAYSIGVGNVVATFGASVTPGQLALLRRHEKVMVWFDADPAGQAGERAVLEALHRALPAQLFRVTPTPGKDLADIADLAEFARYTMSHTMPGSIRLAEIDYARRSRG